MSTKKDEDQTVILKEVAGYFGPTRLTKAAFVSRWTSHISEVAKLAETQADWKILEDMERDVCAMAARAWEKL